MPKFTISKDVDNQKWIVEKDGNESVFAADTLEQARAWVRDHKDGHTATEIATKAQSTPTTTPTKSEEVKSALLAIASEAKSEVAEPATIYFRYRTMPNQVVAIPETNRRQYDTNRACVEVDKIEYDSYRSVLRNQRKERKQKKQRCAIRSGKRIPK